MVSALGLAMVLSSFSAGIQADNLPTNPSANPPGRPAQLFKPSDEPPLRDADACADTGDDLAPAMVVLPPGDFWMGSPDGEAGRYPDEGPSHWVTIPRPFAIGRCEVTVGQFKRFAEEKHYVTTAEQPDAKGCYTYDSAKGNWNQVQGTSWRNPGFAQTDTHPAVCLSWDDAQAYIGWLSRRTGAAYRLPTEAEWEYAARAGVTTPHYWDKALDNSQCRFANGAGGKAKQLNSSWTVADCDDGYAYTAPVANYRPNPFNLYDMLGNTREWTADCWPGSYANAPVDGSAWLDAGGGDCKSRVVRGGSWYSIPQFLRSAYRDRNATDGANNIQGFRLARAL